MAERCALVTGGSGGIGHAIAGLLLDEGFAVTLVGRREAKLHQSAQGLLGHGREIELVAADLAEEAEIQRLVATHSERFGRLDLLVNNAGVGFAAPLLDIETTRLDLQLQLNLRSVVLLHRECLGLLRAAGAEQGALVVNMASLAGKRPQPMLSVYSASKAALIAWTESMRRELIAAGIRSTVICPAYVDTPMSDYIEGEIPKDEMLRVDDVVEAVRMLLRVSPACVVPEIQLARVGGEI